MTERMMTPLEATKEPTEIGWVNQYETRWHRRGSCAGANPREMAKDEAIAKGITYCRQCVRPRWESERHGDDVTWFRREVEWP